MKTISILLLSAFGSVWMVAEKVYDIYPVPHEQVSVAGSVRFTQTVNIISETGIDEYTRSRAAQILSDHGMVANFEQGETGTNSRIYLGVEGSGELVDQKATSLGLKREVFTKAKYDRHVLSLTDGDGSGQACVVILGENTDATFCGLASLEQMLDVGEMLPCVQIYDYADIKDRGVIEGYYGVPYSAEVTKDLFRFMARYKMNTYMYGAKSDPYHSQYWGDPYPTSITEEQRKIGYLTQDMLREITDVAHATKVNFIWAIHPGTAFTNSDNTEVVSNIVRKFEYMYQLGVRQFGIFVDDVGVPTDAATLKLNASRLTQVQNRIDAKWNVAGATPADTVKPLHFVPQLYALSWASEANARSFFGALGETPEKINIYITGNAVWTVPNSSDLSRAKDYLGREVSWWWNYPCNDNDMSKIFPMDTYRNFADETHISGTARLERTLKGAKSLISNPMQQGEVSKIALFSIADYAWNNYSFDNDASWEAAFPAIVGKERAAVFRRIAPYLRYYDEEVLSTLITRYKSSYNSGVPSSRAILEELLPVREACATMCELETSASESDRLLYEDLRPWLLKLQSMLDIAINFIQTADKDNADEGKWLSYVEGIDALETFASDSRFKFNVLYGLGSGISLGTQTAEPGKQALTPFLDWLKENALGKKFFPTLPTRPAFVTNSAVASGTASYSTSTNTGVVRMSTAATLQPGEYVGVELPVPVQLASLTVADTLMSAWTTYWSGDGKQWTKLESSVAPDEYVHYVVFMNEASEARSFRLTRDAFSYTYPLPTKPTSGTVPSGAEFYDNHVARYMYDGDYSTYTCIRRNQKQGDAYTVTLDELTPIHDVRICMGTVNDDYMTSGRVQISADGDTWTTLSVKGSSTTAYTLSLRQNVKYSDEMTYCDFDGKGTPARYVRLFVATPNTSKWLRLYEIDVNARAHASAFQGSAVDSEGLTAEALVDGLGYTSFTPKNPQKNSFQYRFTHLHPVSAVTFYRSAARGAAATVAVTVDGTTWTELGVLSEPMHTFDLSAYPRALAVKVEWTSGVPAVYEVVETLSDEVYGPPTGIGRIELGRSRAGISFDGNTVHLSDLPEAAEMNVYTLDGRRVASAPVVGGGSRVSLDARSERMFVFEVRAADGRRLDSRVLGR